MPALAAANELGHGCAAEVAYVRSCDGVGLARDTTGARYFDAAHAAARDHGDSDHLDDGP
jgi:hypothetical protein